MADNPFEGTAITEEKYPFLAQYTLPVKRMERELVGRKAEMRSLMAGMMRPELCNVILLAEAGSGKALANGTMIPICRGSDGIPAGYLPIEQLKKGDWIFDEKGLPVMVLGVYPQGPRRAYRVTFSDGTGITCNDEHLWTARSQYRYYAGRDYSTYTLRQMMDEGILLKNKSSHWYIPVAGPVSRAEVDLPIPPYALGVYLAAGSMARDGSLQFSIKDKDVMSNLCVELGVRARDFVKLSSGWSLPLNATEETAKWIDAFSRPEFNFADPDIPKEYFLGSIDQRRKLLQGIMDARGVIGQSVRGRCELWLGSARMVRSVQRLAASLGIRGMLSADHGGASLRFFTDIYRERDLFGAQGKLKRLMDRQGASPNSITSMTDMAVTSVDDLGHDVEMTCIYVDSDSHLFQAGYEHIVTHNTALVQGTMERDSKRLYLEVDLAKMISNLADPNEMAAKLKQLFNETAQYCKNEVKEIVLFIDEFHQIVQLSDAAVEALKPLLADSGTRGIRVIAATTYEEFQKYISPNQPLVERLQRMNLKQPDKAMTVAILKGMAERYKVADQFPTDMLYELIYEYTNRYVPASSQPRKSLVILDAMIGWHRSENRPMDQKLLADVIYESQGVNVAFRVDATTIKSRLDEKVLAQTLATKTIEQRLQICVADLNDTSKPMSSFLFCGSTGTGKPNTASTIVPVFDKKTGMTHKRLDEVRVGDFVFDKNGLPCQVAGVFPQGKKRVWEVEFADGRTVKCSADHLWTVRNRTGNGAKNWRNKTTRELAAACEGRALQPGRTVRPMSVVVPAAGPVRWPERDLELQPYAAGALLAGGVFSEGPGGKKLLYIRNADAAAGCARCMRVSPETEVRACSQGYVFTRNGEDADMSDVLSMLPELSGSPEGRGIPDRYMYASAEQRMELLKGLFDAAGKVQSSCGYGGHVILRCASERLAHDAVRVLQATGMSGQVSRERRDGREDTFIVRVLADLEQKKELFSSLKRRTQVEDAIFAARGKSRDKRFSSGLGVRAVRELDYEEEMICLLVDNPDHLFQIGDHVVTHNTEMTKQMAQILFDDSRNLIRMDMTEFANPDSLERFRHEITARIWERPYSIILLDEIEKACSAVTRILLQVLDDGRLSDANGRQVSFTNCYIVMTTNAGSEIFKTIAQYNADDTGSGEKMKDYNKLIRSSIADTTGENRFPPELLGRIDCIVPFQPLSEQTMSSIVKMKLLALKENVKHKHNVNVAISPDVIDYLVKDNLDIDADAGGARAVMAKLESEVTTALARYINAHPDVRDIKVRIGGEMAFKNVGMLKSKAYVVVSEGVPQRTSLRTVVQSPSVSYRSIG